MLPHAEKAANYAWHALDRFDRRGDAEALVSFDPPVRMTYRQLANAVRGMANALWRHGVRSGTAIGVVAWNPPESILLQLAAHLLGCRTSWVAHNTPARFRTGFVRQAALDVFVYDARTLPELGAELAAEVTARVTAPRDPTTDPTTDPALEDRPAPVLCYGPGVGPDLSLAAPADHLAFTPADVRHEPRSLFQTGGTTGLPKLVHHRERFFAAVLALSEHYLATGEPHLRHLLLGGTWHVSAQTAAFMTLFTGGTLFLNNGAEPGQFVHIIRRERVNSTMLTPPQLYQVLDDPEITDADMRRFHTLTIAGSAAAPTRLAEAIDRFGTVLRVVYGMSESPFITALPHLDRDPARPERLASCGPPYPGLELSIRDLASGVECATGTAGEIWIRGALVMDGYWADPALTAETMVDGWLRTGDVGHVDDDGYLYIVDRVKDMIVTGNGSVNIYCRPLESALITHPDVRAAAVVGVPDGTVGEVVRAFVVLAPGATATPGELRAHVIGELNELWSPEDVEIVDALPLTASGKVDKRALRDTHARLRTEDR